MSDIEYTRSEGRILPLQEFDHEEQVRDNVQHHISNAITSLCAALGWCESPSTSFQVIEAITAAVKAKFGAVR